MKINDFKDLKKTIKYLGKEELIKQENSSNNLHNIQNNIATHKAETYEEKIAREKQMLMDSAFDVNAVLAMEKPIYKKKSTEDVVIDLHIEAIPGGLSVPAELKLRYQLDYFNKIIRAESRHKGKRLVFIHGIGEGKLASAIRKELDEVHALTCRYTYGCFGKTIVIIK